MATLGLRLGFGVTLRSFPESVTGVEIRLSSALLFALGVLGVELIVVESNKLATCRLGGEIRRLSIDRRPNEQASEVEPVCEEKMNVVGRVKTGSWKLQRYMGCKWVKARNHCSWMHLTKCDTR